MSDHVALECVTLREGLGTECALVGTFSRVGTDVHTEGPFLGKTHGAEVAAKWPLPSVGSHVRPQVGLLHEP